MKGNRRQFIAGSGAAGLCLAALPFRLGATPSAQNLTLSYDRAAAHWLEALPIGNGRIGAMIFGRAAQERLQLNEDTLWAGSPYNPISPEAFDALPQVRALLAQGKYREASDLAGAKMMARPIRQMPFGSAGDLLIDFHQPAEPSATQRSLSLSDALHSTTHNSKAGIQRREAFACPISQVIVLRLEGTGLDFDLTYRPPSKRPLYGLPDNPATLPWDYREPLSADLPSGLKVRPDGPRALLITGRNSEWDGVPAGLDYAVRVMAISDGLVTADGQTLSVRKASTVHLLIALNTSYGGFQKLQIDPIAKARQSTEAAAKLPYASLRARHITAHRKRFDRFQIDLGSESLPRKTTDRRIAQSPNNDDPSLAALYLQYARYLLLSCSREGSQPAHLQGLWNEGLDPPWGCKYTININTQMNYWPACAANLTECMEPLLRMTEELAVSGAETAQRMYGAGGWVAHHNTDLWRASAPIDGPLWGMWPMGGAWLCTTLWDYWDYSRDKAVLRRLYPLLKGAAQFFAETLIPDPNGRGLITSPSLSPENVHPYEAALCAGPAMDRQILRDLFDLTQQAWRELGSPADDAVFIAKLGETRARLAPDKIGAQGQLQEWLEDWDAAAPEQQHRHVSHLYAVYPSNQINWRDTPELLRAAQVSLDRRGDLATGWGTAWRLCLRARMGQGDRAHAILKGLLSPQRTYPNMFDAHPPFQIDGNFGGAAGIMEMLVQSWGEEAHLLPALPSSWHQGSVRGLCLRGGVTLDMQWKAGKLTQAVLHGRPGQSIKVRYAGAVRSVTLGAKGIASFTPAP